MDTAQSHDFALMKLSAATHSINNDQRRIPLEIMSKSDNNFELVIPGNAAVVPPGDYFLFAMNASGVPSIAEIIRIQSIFGEVALADVHGGYVSANARGRMNSRSTTVGTNEVFKLLPVGGQVALQSVHGAHVSTMRYGSVQATTTTLAGWESWDMQSFGDISYSFLGAHGMHLSSQNDGSLTADRTRALSWESFVLEDPDPTQQITISGTTGNYLSADAQGNVTAAFDEADDNAIWT